MRVHDSCHDGVGLLGDTIQFAEFVERNIRLYQIRHLYPLRPSAAASWIRRSLAESLRSRHPYAVNLLVGGYDLAEHTPNLYWIDYLGTVVEVPFAAHGYGSYFALSLLDKCVLFESRRLDAPCSSLPGITIRTPRSRRGWRRSDAASMRSPRG